MGAGSRILGTVLAAATLAVAGPVAGSLPAVASDHGPTIIRGLNEETIADDFILELCGITADVTVSERWTLKEFPDGSFTLHTVRTYISSDPRIPLERGAATSFNFPDGSKIVVGKPAQLFDPDGGLRVVAAGWIEIDPDDVTLEAHGRDTYRTADQAELYCP